jgi:hypothetical protein
MAEEIEAAGAAITAGTLARALERSGHGAPIGDGTRCANCGAEATSAYCADCGQPLHVHRSLGHFFEEALHGVLHFDTKAWRTIPQLLYRPGTLTHNYIHGKRAQYVSPVALFLFTVFTMFLVFALGRNEAVEFDAATPASLAELEASLAKAETALASAEVSVAEARAAMEPERVAAQSEDVVEALSDTLEVAEEVLEDAIELRDQLKVERDALAAANADTARAIAELEMEVAEIKAEEDAAIAAGDTATAMGLATGRAATEKSLEALRLKAGLTEDEAGASGLAPPKEGQTVFEYIRKEHAAGNIKVNAGSKYFDKKINAKLENPELAWYKIQNTAYKFSFLLIPISLPFVWLMFAWKKNLTLFDHSVFVLYSLSFVSLVLIGLVLLSRLPFGLGEPASDTAGTAFVFGLPVHYFFHLKGTYSLGVFSALWRTIYLLFGALVSLTFFFVSILTLGLLG